MKTTIYILLILAAAFGANAQKQLREATAAEVAAGTAGFPAVVTPRMLGPNDSTTANFIAARTNLSLLEQTDISGMIEEITARGYRANLVDVWPMQPRWGTNFTSLYGVRYSGNVYPWAFTNRENFSSDNAQLVLPLRKNVTAFTLAIVVEHAGAYLHNPQGSEPSSYRVPFWQMFNTNDNSSIALWSPNALQVSILASQGGTFPVSYMTNLNQYQSNEVMVARAAGTSAACFGEAHLNVRRTTWIISYDGAGKFQAWENGNPCAFPLNNGTTTASLRYDCPITVSSSMQQIVLGYSQFFKTNINAGGHGFNGKIDSIILFDRAAETNTIDSSTGFVSGSPLASCAFAASRWLEASTVEMIADGTSMMNNSTYNGVGADGNHLTNCVWQAWFARHPEWPDVQIYCGNGGNIQANTNCGGQLGLAKFQLPYVGLYQLPSKVTRKIIFTDHPRNDNNMGVSQAIAAFTSYYTPLKALPGVEIWQGSLSIGNTNQTAFFPTAAVNVPAICVGMATNPVISKFVPLFKYISQGGIVDVNDINLAVVRIGTVEGAHYVGTNAQYYIEQYINLADGLQFYPKAWPVYYGLTNAPTGYLPTTLYMMATTNNPFFYTNATAGTSVEFFFSCTTNTWTTLNGSFYPMPVTGGTIKLLPNEWICITNPVNMNAGYRPLAPSLSFP